VKAVILAGGEGTRLRPLTLTTPKPIAPVLERPLLRYQLDLLASAGVSDVVFAVGYRPERIQDVFGDGRDLGIRIHYAVESSPLGTGGAVKHAEPHLDEITVVLNGDVLTDLDLSQVLAAHRAAEAAATLVLTPVDNPAAYGLVETRSDGRVERFLEKPDPDQITTDTINAGVYVLATPTLSLIPPGVPHSIERGFFPALLERGDTVCAHVHRGYWIDIGTPAKYRQVHRDVLDRRFQVPIQAHPERGGWIAADAEVAPAAHLEAPFYVGPRCQVATAARIGAGTVLLDGVRVDEGAELAGSVIWPGSRIGTGARVRGALLAERVQIGRHAEIGEGTLLGEAAVLPDYSQTAGVAVR
jgi:NDP-sugar pyrophosphorylase family protein